MTDPNIKEILSRCTVGGLPNTYILGNNARRVTFHSQQRRAFNLIWALFEDGRLKAGDTVGIIGGGLAGMTAAIAAKAKGCRVTIYEQGQTLLPLWRMNNQRYIHPNIYDWPRPGSEIELTSLPALNWHAEFAKNVADQIMTEWDYYGEDIVQLLPFKVDLLEGNSGKIDITTETFELESFDCVIAAVGFGLEETRDVPNAVTYWMGDAIDATPATTGGNHKTVLITGCGDGGLIDALRLSLINFDHQNYSEHFLQQPGFKAITQAIIDAEDLFKTMDAQAASEHIYNTYRQLITPDLTDLLRSQIRSDTTVILNSKTKTPLNQNASIHNRVLVTLLIKLRLIKFKRGEATKFTRLENGQYTVTITKPNGVAEPITVDSVIIRHGPKELLTGLFGPACTIPTSAEPDPTSAKLWPDDFYAELPSPTPNQQQYMDDHIPSLLARIGTDRMKYKVMVGITEVANQPAYSLAFSHEAPEGFLEGLHSHKGYLIVLERNDKPVVSQIGTGNFDLHFRHAQLIEGAPIANRMTHLSGDRRFGTLGCFVASSHGQLGFISTSHSLLSPTYRNSVDVDLLYDKNYVRFMKTVRAGKVTNFSQLRYVKTGEQEKQENLFDAGLVIVDTPLKKPVYRDSLKTVRPYQIFIGQRVKKTGAGSGETEGRVTAVSCRVEVDYDQGTVAFKNVFQVKGITKPFSTTGDSGALVINERGEAMGIVFAGNDSVSYVCPIEPILEAFNCRAIRVGEPPTQEVIRPL